MIKEPYPKISVLVCWQHPCTQLVYEWDQTVSEVNLYVSVPPGVRAKQLYVDILQTHIKFGMHPNPPFLDVSMLCLRAVA